MLLKGYKLILLFFAIVAFSPVTGSAQGASFDTIRSATDTRTVGLSSPVPKRMNYNIQVGTQFFTSSYGSGFSTFISPHLTYGLSKRFSLSGGVSIVNTTLNGLSYSPSFPGETKINGNFTTAMVYVSGQYLLSDRITISGTAYKQFNLFGDAPGYAGYGKNNLQGLYMNVKYKLMENVHLEAGFGYSSGNSPYNTIFNDPFDHTFGDPFYHPIH